MPLKFMRRIPGTGDNRRNKDDPDYEEVGPVTIHLKHTADGRGDGKHCEVCGSAQAVVRCANCSGQVFCEACDEVFHRHPRRTQHCRRAMEGVRPPLPPKAVEGGKDMIPPPQPPPRRNKRSFLGGTNLRKDQLHSGSLASLRQDSTERLPSSKPPAPPPPVRRPEHLYSRAHKKSTSGSTEGPLSEGGDGARTTIMSSLKRFMGSRPLPAPPSGASKASGSPAAGGGTLHSNLIRSLTSPDLANDEDEPALAVAIPQTVVDLTHEDQRRGERTPVYPPLPRPPASTAGIVDAQNKINSAGHQRKLSLQQAPLQRDEKRQSMIDVGASWDSSANRHRSQSVSEEQWTQLMQAKTPTPQSVPSTPPVQEPPPIHRSRFNSAVSAGGRAPGNVPVRGVRGMTSSTSVCDLNMLSQQQQQQPQMLPPNQSQHPHQLVPRMGAMHPSGSFQQLNLVPYSGGMIWAPAPCDMCHGPAPMYPPPHQPQGMKRAASNLSMNMSSASSDVSGYPWQPPHMHHHMPHPMYPGYYPPPPGPHLMQGSMQGSTISIPDSMAVFSKVSSSPAASVRSSSRRSHKSNKSRSFSQADISRRTRSSHRSDSDETTSTSQSGDDDILNNSKPGYPGGILAWQCDHCTFINQAGSRVCGMCSKTQASTAYHRSSKRATERRRSEQRRFGNRRNDQEDDDREPSDFENDVKHNNHQTHTNGREHRRDRSSKLSTASRNNSKKKHRRRAGSSGSASDVVDELERQLSDIKVSKSRTTEFDGLPTRYKERERERDRERGSRRREGLSGRIKSRSKNASERSRTPGRPSPDSQSTHSSPRAPSPADDEVFENEEQFNDKKKENNNNNSHSNEGTLIGLGNSDETILATEQIAAAVHSDRRKSQSAHSSRASTPDPLIEIQHAEVQILPPIEAVEVLPEPKPSDHLDLPKRKEKSPSPFRLEVEEISFANTLDDVATMGTNEVADIDPSLDERPFSALPPIEEPQVEIPCVQYVEPISSHEELMETALISEHESLAVEKANSSSIKVEEINEQFDTGGRVDGVQVQQLVTDELVISTEKKKQDQEAEQIELKAYGAENSLVANENRADREQRNLEDLNDIGDASVAETKENETIAKNSHQSHLLRHYQPDARPPVLHQERSPSNGSFEDVLGRPASSLESSPGFNRALRDCQYTPLSFSSSDAAFYSPADSQDDSADERTRSRPDAPRQAMQTVVVAAGDEELVTALESLKSTEDRRSSRETIKSSVDDLPYSPEDPGEETSDISIASPLDETLRHPDDRDEGDTSEHRPTSAEGGYASSDVYEGLTFQDALSGNADVRPLQKSASDQMLLRGQRKSTEEQSPKVGRRVVTDIDDRYLTVDELITKRQQEAMKRDGLELVQVLRDAERAGYRAEEVSAALPVCGEKGPLAWLMDNWWHMVHTVMTLASTYGREKKENNFGQISEEEARAALRTHKGDIWAAVTESVEQRQTKFAELTARGSFPAPLVAQALQRNAGDLEAAHAELLRMRADAGADERDKTEAPAEAYSRTDPQERPPENPCHPEPYQDEDTSIYSNLVSTNANLVSKTEALMQEIEEEAPMLSKELKLKIVHAILDEEPGLDDDRPHMDSDEESTIEELLAREQNPTFYEYFTAVDLDDEGESRRAETAEDDTGSHFYSDDAASEQYFETGNSANTPHPAGSDTPHTAGQSAPADRLSTEPNYDQRATASDGHTAGEMLYVRKEDVTVHPLKTYPKFTNLSGAHFEDAVEKCPSSASVATSEKIAPPSSPANKFNGKLTEPLNAPQPHTKSVIDNEKPGGAPVDSAVSGVTLRQKKSSSQGPEESKPQTRSSVTYETSSSEEDESVSVTTGRLSLTLSHTSDKDGAIDVTAATVENERIQTDLSPRVRSPAASKSAGRPNFASIRQTDIRHIAQLEERENSANAATQAFDQASESRPHSSAAGGVATETTATSSPQQDPPVKQEPVKKASSIIGKAIAKAMARESSVRDGTPPVHSPEPEESSRGSTPASYTQESTAASSMFDSDGSTPVSTTPMSMTPRSTPDLQEDQAQGGIRGEVDSEDDDLLRSLDTIPEEGPLKDPSATKEASTPKMLSPKATKKETSPATEEDGLQEHNRETGDPPLSGAQLLAEENTNTVKRSPKNTGKKGKDETAKEKISKTENIENEDKEVEERGSNSQEKPHSLVSTKPKVAKNRKSTQKTKQAASGSESNSSSEAASVKTPGVSAVNKTGTKGTSKESLASDSNESSSALTVKPKVQGSSLLKKTEPKTISGDSSATSAAAAQDDDSSQSEPTNDSHQSTPTDDSAQAEPIDGPLETKAQDDPHQAKSEEDSGDSDDEGAVVQGLEELRGREPDHSEVTALKQQVTDIKQSLQSQIDDGTDTTSPAAQEGPSGAPTITVEQSGGDDDDEVPPKRRTAEENTEYEQLRFDRTVRRLLAEGQAGSYEKAELAAHLLTLSFDEEDSVAAAQECSSIYGALHFLQQECELCAEKYPMRKMVSMLYCTHRCCTECARTYFTYQIKTKNIREMRCPFCNEPNLDNTAEESTAEYFNHLDILLKGIVDAETHELFQRKLRDLTLMSDPNFRWCNKCSSGFIANPRARKLICPDCRDITCAHCRLPWEAQHEGISCDAFAKWKQENDPEAQAQGVAKHLAENGITCPKCRFQYSLAKGGCMHFTCTECKYEFCSGCGQPFRQGARCPVGPYCERLGLHAHHPRNCLFYLRDKEPPQLQQLLKENNVPFDTELADEDGQTEEGGSRRQCQVPEQKETPEGLVDDICGRSVLQGNAGLCRLHYVEYLVEKINSHHLDPVIIFDEADLRVCLRRNGKSVPVRRWESEKLYRDKLIKLIKEQLPL